MSVLRINSNIAALGAQRYLTSATQRVNDSFTRLSSGLRINRAVDDAAGLAISESLKADNRILNQGIRNLNDGVSLLSVADGALNELSHIMTRLGELAAQSANGTFSNRQRLTLDQEAQALAKEFNRIARSTSFNTRVLFNGDFGELKLVAGGGQESIIRSGLGGGIGDGTFRVETSFATNTGLAGFAPGDFNGDGFLDVAIADYAGDAVKIMFGNGNGSFRNGASFHASPTGAGVSSLRIADFNGDRVSDIYTMGSGVLGDSVLIGNGDGSFKLRIAMDHGGADVREFVDLNSDEILDLVENTPATGFQVNVGNGNGTFKPGFIIGSGTPFDAVSFEDLNNDGALDIVAADNFLSRLHVFMGNGDGSYRAGFSFATYNAPRNVYFADFNNDGVADIVNGHYDSFTAEDKISVHLGIGNGQFSPHQALTVGFGAIHVSTGDVNGDGNSDIAALNADDGFISVLIGNGNGTFTAQRSYGSTLLTFAISGAPILEDLNSDGVLDMLSPDGSNNLMVFLGNSNEGISAIQPFSLRSRTKALEAMSDLRSVLTSITKQRGKIGAFESRIAVAASTLGTTALNYNDARSRITDVDVAEEAARLAASQILQQSSASVLARANLQPSLALQLLEGL